jgi:quinone-modifying oxidoreductase subunit QmoA
MQKVAEACSYDAIDLSMAAQTHEITAGAVVFATGWDAYDANKLETLGYRENPDVITNVEMERIAAPNGPTGGKIIRPSDGDEIASIAFVQCAGSRDENHLPYCSSVCCLASMKQALYVREMYPDADVHIFYIDLRAPGRLEDFYTKTQADEKIQFHRGKVGKVAHQDGKLVLQAEDTMTGHITTATVDMVVLATGMVPQTANLPDGANIACDDMGFVTPETEAAGLVGAGVCTQPLEVACTIQDATGAALKGLLQLGGE